MHQQIKASPDTTAENFAKVVELLAEAGINIEAIAPDFDPPHVRVLVQHHVFDDALDALSDLSPTVMRSVEPVRMPNKPKALWTAMQALGGQGHEIQSVLVLPGAQGQTAMVSFGVAGDVDQDWPDQADALRVFLEDELANLPD